SPRHIAAEVAALLGHAESLPSAPGPQADPSLLASDTSEIPVQVNGKMRGRVTVPADANQDAVVAIARADDNVRRHLEGQNVRRAIYVRGRILNFVVGG